MAAIELQGCDQRTSGSGNPVGLSRNRVLQVAFIEHLVGLGLSLSKASDASLKFTDEGSTARAPGALYPHAKTILVITPEDATVRNIFSYTSLSDVTNHSACVVLVDCNRIADRVDAILERET